jgi:hypothetical protein
LDLAVLDKEPLSFPSRTRFTYNPGVSDRQLWALGMIVVQWSMTEQLIDMNARKLVGDDGDLLAEYNRQRRFQNVLAFWRTQIELKCSDPQRSQLQAIIPRIQALSSQRDEVVHRMWGGGYESMSSEPGPLTPSTDGGLMPKAGEKLRKTEGLIPFTWHATFSTLRRIAREMAELNKDLLVIIMLPPESAPPNSPSA